MVFWHRDEGRKISGGKIRQNRKKKKYEKGNQPNFTMIGEEKNKVVKTKGGNVKVRLIKSSFINVYDPNENKVKKVKILSVNENKANPHFVRSNIITKGCIVKTEIGLVRVTSRPSQEGVLNGVLIQD